MRAFVNVDRLSSGGAVVRGNTFQSCGAVHFKSIGGVGSFSPPSLFLSLIALCLRLQVVSDNFMNHTGGIGIVIWPQWLEGSVGLRDVLVARNSFAPNAAQAVIVGNGTRNITIIPA